MKSQNLGLFVIKYTNCNENMEDIQFGKVLSLLVKNTEYLNSLGFGVTELDPSLFLTEI